MKIELSENEVRVLLKYLGRATLTGNEATEFMMLVQKIQVQMRPKPDVKKEEKKEDIKEKEIKS